MNDTLTNVIPAASSTWAAIRRTPGDPVTVHPVPAWASVNGGPLVAMVHVNETGRLTSVEDLEETCNAVSVFNTFRNDDPDPMDVVRYRERQAASLD